MNEDNTEGKRSCWSIAVSVLMALFTMIVVIFTLFRFWSQDWGLILSKVTSSPILMIILTVL